MRALFIILNIAITTVCLNRVAIWLSIFTCHNILANQEI